MDRERQHKRRESTGTASGSSGSPKKPRTHARRISGSTSTESASASTSAGEAAKNSSSNQVLHSPFPLPDGTSSNILPPPVSEFPHPHHSLGHPTPGSSPGGGMESGLGKRIRYREQGVDELLQLKLHQALAATDDVPKGATIVLATGDGNVGQFSEDGFLGPFWFSYSSSVF